MWLAYLFNINHDIFQIHYNKRVELFSKDFINIALNTGWSVGEFKRHNLILEVAVPVIKSSLSFVAFSDSHPMVGTG